MSAIFLYEYEQENVVNENSGSEHIDYVVDQNGFYCETIATHTEYLLTATSSESSLACPMLIEKTRIKILVRRRQKQNGILYAILSRIKLVFFDLKIEKCMSASAAAKQLGIHIRTAEKWTNQYNVCPESIFESCKKVGRKSILFEEHKMTVINFIDANPSSTVVKVTEHLLKQLHYFQV
ncbi:hypothetical protein RO3G_02616 [Rhizopus delemar RA 99-880]|uniref:Uncharacterized protein n=1 Tax=Rhizopus delemar (strain RA 99-880 / ATCC MYA-4621 / FGSC 9543 / NRRL 43880) TaxID=246409 RepID=I1BNY2_RHIO9|nr:hypothetical protein RO3G_02616 [Rhizopus delemar RA 99-880]|eukprot:EIE77912.1 hypothetical protein RO3G_02616 [Rhizopus delemar RA 99-880]